MSLHLAELGIEHDRVFLDTGWEHSATYEYIRGPLTEKLGPIIELRAERRRFCTTELKVRPMATYLAGLDYEVINAVGIRREESTARSSAIEWEYSDAFDCETWRPIVTWTEHDVRAIHARHGLAPNPLYLQGASRVGCWPCIYARKAEIKLVADSDPARIDLIRALEADVGAAMTERASKRGETLDSEPSWFQAPLGRSGTWSIDRVVQWSRTLHGGRTEDKQVELFSGADDACMRWGLCETDVEP
jgi:3'-phosphoadenosine 5'-phosphosulfate sulfotransferase (PAPS reductase)/FAD synthetase